jgi:hypothetical protein
MNINKYERLAGRVKQYSPYGEPPQKCLRCGEPHDFTRGINLYWEEGLGRTGEPILGGVCGGCMSELLTEWGYPEAEEE